jgi:hypothetical protein
MLKRRVEEGAEYMVSQRTLMARLKQDGLPTHAAEAILVTFENIQRQHNDHLARSTARKVG